MLCCVRIFGSDAVQTERKKGVVMVSEGLVPFLWHLWFLGQLEANVKRRGYLYGQYLPAKILEAPETHASYFHVNK